MANNIERATRSFQLLESSKLKYIVQSVPNLSRGDVGFPILFGGGFLSDTYPDVFRCILHVS